MSMKKAIDGATKPKRAAPKAKYIDPIVQATFQQDGQIREIVQCLSAKLRDPSQTVEFKALIVLHTIMRSGHLEAVFSYLSTSSTSLSLSSPEAANVAAYGQYLACRIKSYGNLKRDVVRDKSDRRAANRLKTLTVEQGLLRETREIQRMIAALVEAKFYTEDVDDDVSMTALRLLVKDLLVLFTAVNEGVINVLEHYFEMSHVDATLALKIYKTFCRDTEKVVAYLGTAKRLYNVLNIPIPNIRHAPLSLAKSLEEYLNDPNFEQNRQEYKENKRIADGGRPRSATPKATSTGEPASSKSAPTTSAASPSPAAATPAPPKSFTDFFESIEQQQTPMFNSPPPQHTGMFPGSPFGPLGGGGGFIGAQPTGMPFGAPGLVMPQMTGNPFMQPQMTGGFGMMQQPQMTGAFGGTMQQHPQMTGMQPNPFRQSMMPASPNPFGMPQQQQQQTGMAFTSSSMPPPVPQVQPHMTGAASGPFGQPSPFGGQQQSHLAPQQTGNPFGPQRAMSMMAQPTGNPFQTRPTSMMPSANGSTSVGTGAGGLHGSSATASPSTQQAGGSTSSGPARSNTMPAPLTQQKTGMRNPFAPAPGTLIPQTEPQQTAPPVPSLNELAHNSFAARLAQQQTGTAAATGGGTQPQWTTFGQSAGNAQAQGSTKPAEQSKKPDAFSAFVAQQREKEAAAAANGGTAPLISQKTGGLFADVASDLARASGNNHNTVGSASSAPTSPFGTSSNAFSAPSSTAFSSSSATTSPTSLSGPFSSLSFSSTGGGTTSNSSAPYLTAQSTGFAGSNVRPFQPTSSFGSKLASEMSPAPPTPLSTQPTGAFGGNSASVNGNTSSSFPGSSSSSSAPPPPPAQSPLQAQSTGFNPFGGTKLPPLNTPLSAGITSQTTGYSGVATGSLI